MQNNSFTIYTNEMDENQSYNKMWYYIIIKCSICSKSKELKCVRVIDSSSHQSFGKKFKNRKIKLVTGLWKVLIILIVYRSYSTLSYTHYKVGIYTWLHLITLNYTWLHLKNKHDFIILIVYRGYSMLSYTHYKVGIHTSLH